MDIAKLREDIVFDKTIRGFDVTFHSTWGLFSPTDIDEGTKLLIGAMQVNPTDLVLDLGCGYGAIGITASYLAPKGHIHMVDKDFVAVAFAQKNAQVNNCTNCEIYLSNGFDQIDGNRTFHVIASNLPAKVGKEMLTILIVDAKKHLKPGGKLYVVTILGLKEYIKRAFEETFGNWEKVAASTSYIVSLATRK